MNAQLAARSYIPSPMISSPLTRFTQRACRAKNRVIGCCSAPLSKDNTSSGRPNPSPNHTKVPSRARNPAERRLMAKIETTSGPEHGSAIGP